jgi:hypothetical protein
LAVPKVFITYRREETAAYAGRLYDATTARFGEGNVFMDVDMAPGVDFVERITEAVAACQALIVVVGPRWATVEDEHGTPRIANPQDVVRLEVETALRRPDVTLIPVLVSGARMPKGQDLPAEVRAITRRNALELSDQRWRYDVGRLISTLDELLAGIPGVSGAPAPERNGAAGKAAPRGDAQAPEQSAPLGTVAATSVKTKLAAPLAGGGRRLRWALLAAMAIVAVVVAVILAAGGGGSSSSPARFTKADLPDLVLPGTDAPGDLLFRPTDANGPAEGRSAVTRQLDGDVDPAYLPRGPQASYKNEFGAKSDRAKPYWYANSMAVVFKDDDAAQAALDDIKGYSEGPEVRHIPARDLGDDRVANFVRPVPRDPEFSGSWEGSEYHYAWRTGNLVQIFGLDLSGPGVSEATARHFADQMDARSATAAS